MKHKLITVILTMGFLSGLFGCKKDDSADSQAPKADVLAESESDLPPVPQWTPGIVLPEEKIIDRFSYYTDGKKDFVVFRYGTCVIVEDGLSESEAKLSAKETVLKIFNYHPDMNPVNMDDGNILVQYNHPAYNVVLDEIASKHLATIKANHQKALARDEVLITPLGSNKFDEFGMKALFGRCYFFMDAKDPVVSKVVRKVNLEQASPAPGGTD